MIVGAYVRNAAPDHPAGAEWSLHDTLVWLAARGHECQILAERGATRALVDGVSVWSQPSMEETDAHFKRCDVMLTQLEATQSAQFLSSGTQTPLVHLLHSENQLAGLGVLAGCSALACFNTEAVAEACSWWHGASMILHPVVREERVRVDASGGVMATLINVSHEKGGMMLVKLAEMMPARLFMGVQGAYGQQAYGAGGIPGHGDNPMGASLPANLGISGVVSNMRPIYEATRVLMILSRSETYGRVGVEAMVSGIPVVAARTPGIVEALGDAARYLDSPTDAGGAAVLVSRAFGGEHPEWSAESRERASYVAERATCELELFEAELQRIATDAPRMTLTHEPA